MWPLEQTNIHTSDHKTKTKKLILTCPPTEQTPIVHPRKTLQRQIESTFTFIQGKEQETFPFVKRVLNFFRCGLPPPPKSSFPLDPVLGQSLPCQGRKKDFYHRPIFALSRWGKTFFTLGSDFKGKMSFSYNKFNNNCYKDALITRCRMLKKARYKISV